MQKLQTKVVEVGFDRKVLILYLMEHSQVVSVVYLFQ